MYRIRSTQKFYNLWRQDHSRIQQRNIGPARCNNPFFPLPQNHQSNISSQLDLNQNGQDVMHVCEMMFLSSLGAISFIIVFGNWRRLNKDMNRAWTYLTVSLWELKFHSHVSLGGTAAFGDINQERLQTLWKTGWQFEMIFKKKGRKVGRKWQKESQGKQIEHLYETTHWKERGGIACIHKGQVLAKQITEMLRRSQRDEHKYLIWEGKLE